MLDHQPLTLLVAVGTLVLTVLLYIVIPKGFFPLQDTGFIQGITAGGPDRLLRRDGASASRRSPASAAAIPMSRACRPSSASTAPTPR